MRAAISIIIVTLLVATQLEARVNEKNYVDLIIAEGAGGRAEANDPGGLTVFGLCKRYDPTWKGWERFDIVKGQQGWQRDPELLRLVREEYAMMWNQLGLSAIDYAPLTGCILGGYVNQGPKVIRWVQEILGVKADKVMGPQTIAALKKACDEGRGEEILNKLIVRRVEYYAETAHPDFVRGLVLRVVQGGA